MGLLCLTWGVRKDSKKGCENRMSVYLNSSSAYGLFRREYASRYYVDKSGILADLVQRVELDLDDIEEQEVEQEMHLNMSPSQDLATLEKQ